MASQKMNRAPLVLAVAALGLAGCVSTQSGPAPLTPAPTQPVQQDILPPLPQTQPTVPGQPTGTEPGQLTTGVDGQPTPEQVAKAKVASFEKSATAIKKDDLLGGWTISTDSDNCQLFTSLTAWKGGHRATSRNCAGDLTKAISAWKVNGKQLELLDKDGATMARLYRTSDERYNGALKSGGSIMIWR